MPEQSEFHPSVSAMGSHLDEELGGKQTSGFWSRVERELHDLTRTKGSEAQPTKEDKAVEEAMHLGQ